MLDSVLVVGGSVLTLFFMMAVGFILGKLGILTTSGLSQMSTLLLYIVSPAVTINAFLAETPDAATLNALLVAAAALVAVYVLSLVLVSLSFRRTPLEQRGISRCAVMFGNAGFMGIPLIQAVLGSAGMLTAVTSMVVFNLFLWTYGAYLVGGRDQVSLRRALLNPGMIGFAVAMVLFLLPIPVPAPLGNAVSFLGDMNSPLAMVVIGGQMAAVDLKSLFKEGRLYLVSLAKLLVIPAIALVVLYPFHLDPVLYCAVVILSGCPTAGATSLFAQLMGKDTGYAAKLVTLSTLLCIITLPLMAAAAGALGG